MTFSRTRQKRVALAVTTALVSFSASSAVAQTVTFSADATVAAVNTAIATQQATPSANIGIALNSPAKITGGGNVFLAPLAAGQGDGAISFTNSATLGTAATPVGVSLVGVNSKVAANTATVTNTGVVTGGVSAANFGGNVSVTNGGTIEGFVNATGYGDVSVGNSAGAKINDPVAVTALSTITSAAPVVTSTGPDPVTGDFTNKVVNSGSLAGGSAAFSNAGYVQGNVNVVGYAGTTVVNSGQVTGATSAVAVGSVAGESTANDAQVTGVAGTVTTVTNTSTLSSSTTATGANVTGTYSGTNGEASFAPVTQGTITQTASGDSNATLSGTLYGSLNSNAGFDFLPQTGKYDRSAVTTTVVDSATPANNTTTYAFSETQTRTGAAGTSTVTVSGLVSDYLGAANVNSSGSTASNVAVSGTVQGSVNSTGRGVTTVKTTETIDAKQVGAPLVTTRNEYKYTQAVTHAAGSAVGNVTGTGSVTGSLNVNGVSLASAQVDAGAKVGGSVSVNAGQTDTTFTSTSLYTYDPAADAAAVINTSGNARVAVGGDASATVNGQVGGSVFVNSANGNATANVAGKVNGFVRANANTATVSDTVVVNSAGTGASTSVTDRTETRNSVHSGGKATVLVNTSAALQAQGIGSTVPSVSSVSASGLGGAEVTIAAGSRVDNSVEAYSLTSNTAGTRKWTYVAGSGTDTDTYVSTPVGNSAVITNNGIVDGYIYAEGKTAATVTNTGTVGSSLEAYSLYDGFTSTFTDNDWANSSPSTRKQVRTVVYTAGGGAATVNNSGTANGVYLGGATGTLNNGGTIAGNVYLGSSVVNGTYVQTITSTTTGSPAYVFTPAATLFTQTYTVNQNGKLTGNVYVRGADYNSGYGVFKTSNVAATINLNAGSETVGSFFNENNTTAVVNVNGGKLTLTGPAYVPVSATVAVPTWSAGLAGGATAGSFALNVNSGTVQVAPVTTGSKKFGINGNVTVGANGTLVVGLLNTPVNAGSGSSITATTPTVSGANLVVSGNLASTGTIAVGMNGALVRTGLAPSTSSPDFLAPITTVLGYGPTAFTTPAVAGVSINSPSTVAVGGNLSLGGKVQVYVPTGSIFTGTESQTLFTVGGTITNTATVQSNFNSRYVTLSAATSGQNVVLKAARLSYATGAANPNAAAAAVALDKAIPGVVKVLVDDASGIRSYSSIAQLNQVQDVANIVSNLDWNLSSAQAAAVFEELASGSIYGSLANLRQNVAFTGQLDVLTERREDASGIKLWLTPIGNFAKFGGTASGASKVDATSYGAAVGLDFGYGEGGAFGFGFGYARHNVDAQSFAAAIDADTYTLGAYWTQAFGPLAVNAQFSYGFSSFDAERNLSLLSRTVTADFRGNEWDGSLGLSYSLKAGGLDVEPFAELALRHWKLNGFTEEGGAGLGLKVESASKTVFNPTIGVRLGGNVGSSDAVKIRPYGSIAYTFQGDAGTARTVGYIGDPAANTFVLNGVNPKGYATVGAGINTLIADKVNVSLGGTYAFGSNNNVAAIRSAIGIKF